jgi:peptidoglycan/xylan/chitin deacetylase (PgdA/CDA1 family)
MTSHIRHSAEPPAGTRITVALTFLMENWSDGKAPPYSPMTSPPKPGVPDRAGIQWSKYGGHAGIARLLHIARQHGVGATVCANARSAELFPETIRHIVANGFELAGHNYTQDEVLSGLNEADERQLIRKCLGILTEISGIAPVGWLSSTIATNDHTAALLAEQGLLWHGDYNEVDLPGCIDTEGGPLVAIPHSDYADNRVLRGAPRDWTGCYRDMFDYLYRREPGAFINITMHGNFGGRPLMSAQLDLLLGYMLQHDGVWMPQHDELARWVRKQGLREVPFAQRVALPG